GQRNALVVLAHGPVERHALAGPFFPRLAKGGGCLLQPYRVTLTLQIIEGAYSPSGNVLRVYDETDRLLGTDTLHPGDDAVHAARKILKEKRGKHLSFYDPISCRSRVV